MTPTAPPINTPTVRELLAVPLPEFLQGNLLVRTDRFKEPMIAVMEPDGNITQALTGEADYVDAVAGTFSPDRTERVVVAPDEREILQIWIEKQDTLELRRVTGWSARRMTLSGRPMGRALRM